MMPLDSGGKDTLLANHTDANVKLCFKHLCYQF